MRTHRRAENPPFTIGPRDGQRNWKSRELWQAHMSAPHLPAYMEATEVAVAQFMVNEMSGIGWSA